MAGVFGDGRRPERANNCCLHLMVCFLKYTLLSVLFCVKKEGVTDSLRSLNSLEINRFKCRSGGKNNLMLVVGSFYHVVHRKEEAPLASELDRHVTRVACFKQEE